MEWIKANETRIPELERKAFVNEIFMYCDNDKKMKGNLGKVWKEYKVANDRTRGGTISLVSDSSIINYGDITSNDASITIKCRVFKNFGRVQSKNNAAITIQCHSFDQENNSNIAPKPTIIMPWQYLMLDAKQQYIQLDVNRIPDTERDDFRTAALNATYKIKYFDAQHVEQFVDEICIDQGANEEKENLNIHNALDLIAIDQNHLYSFIEIMVSVLENKSNSDRTYASYKFERELLLDIYDMHQNTPLEIDYQLDVHKFNSETGSGGCIEIHSKSAIIIQKNGAIYANECASETTITQVCSNIVDPLKYPKLEGKTDKIMEWIKANETRIPELERKAFVNEIFMYCDNDKKMKGSLGRVWKEYKVANDRTRGGTISLVSDSSIINYGDITSNGTCGGFINIKCERFQNFGRIECKKGGR
eukprot:902612_1